MTHEPFVVQLPMSEEMDFDSLIGIENGLIQLFKESGRGVVTRHDIGRGRFNIFIESDESWAAVLGRLRAFLDFHGVLDSALIASRANDAEAYEVLWPSDYKGAFEP